MMMQACIVMCAGAFCSAEMADEIDNFFKENPIPSSSRKISQMTEGIRANSKFLIALQASGLSKDEFWTAL
jgi:puromycin-sensitive aminopeptidase